jgi:hypothetical protein
MEVVKGSNMETIRQHPGAQAFCLLGFHQAALDRRQAGQMPALPGFFKEGAMISPCFAKWTIHILGLALLLAVTAFGQSTTGSISGIVKGSSGAPIPDATVTITNPANNLSRIVTTGSTGLFIAPQLPPGAYTISVEKQGFRKLVRNEIVLTAANQLSTGSLVLEVGAVTETVTQTTGAGRLELQAASGERSGLLTSVEIKDLALNGRNMLELLAILPGVGSFVNGQVSSPTQLGSLHINGTRFNQHELTIDGSSNVDTGSNSAVHVTINPDAVAEVKVLSANYQAEYGRSAGGFIQFVTKSGTRNYHGTARFFHRHEGLNANNYFRNAEGRNPDGSEIQPRPLYRFNYFGYDIGGPVYLPRKFFGPLGGWNQGKDKLFFYWNQEFYRQLIPPGAARNIRVPTPAERKGDFSQTVDGNGNKVFIRDPLKTGLCNAANQTACFPGNIIPPERFFRDGPAILNLYPLPNFSGENRFNYISSLSTSYPRREDIIRLDYHLSQRTRLTVRYIGNSDLRLLPYGNNNNAANFLLSRTASAQPGRNGVISLSHSFSPTLTNEFIFGPSSNRINIAAEDEKATRRAHQITFPLLFPQANDSDYLPTFQYGGIANIPAFPNANLVGLPLRSVNHTFNFSDNLVKVWGAHATKAGIFIQRSRKDQTTSAPVNSTINFNNNVNNPFNTGHPFANALLGIYNNYTQASNSPLGLFRYWNVEGYLQDNWKVTSRLTLDYGLRIAWYQPQYDARLQAGFFNPELYDRAKAVRLYEPICINNVYPCTTGAAVANLRAVDPANRPAAPTLQNTLASDFIGLIVPGSGDLANGIGRASQGYPRGGFEGRGVQWGPRFGFAYDLFGQGKTVVRGGAGIFYDRIAGNPSFATLTNPPTVFFQTLANGRLQELQPGSGTLSPPTVFGFSREGRIPTVYSFSLGVQREVGFNTVVDVAYVATLSRHLAQQRNLNAIPYGTTFGREAQDPTRYAGGVVPELEPGLPEAYRQAGLKFSGANAQRPQFLAPFPGYGFINYTEFVGSANYHSLQLAVNRRFSRGLHFGISYTWSKALSTALVDSEVTHPYDTRRYDYRLPTSDRRHVFGAGFVYDTPKLSRYLGHHRLAKALFDNWQLSGIAAIVSGAPLELGVGIEGINAGQRLTGSYTEGPRFYFRRPPQPGPNGLQIDPDAFLIPAIGDVGPWPRQYLHGPGINNQNLSLFKNFPLGGEGGRSLQLRFEMFNAFNHTQFAGINLGTNLAVPNASGGFTTGNAIFSNYSQAVITSNLRPAGSTLPLGRFFGEYLAARDPRIIQLGIKLYF